jgi:hypothetical protein
MQTLKLHPKSRCATVTRIDVDVSRPEPGALVLHYAVTGKIRGLSMPPITPASRADGLWQHTCFEAFIRPAFGSAYYELNFAPSTQWAAYRFDGYRAGMRVADVRAPAIETRQSAEQFELHAAMKLADLQGNAFWRLGLSAVIEEADGNKSYWALAHPPGKPDFHHSDCFALELPGA